MKIAERIAELRREMRRRRLAAYLVPSTDPHMSEYMPELWERRRWASGFSGSAGELLVTTRSAGLWTDGRYFLQAATELRGNGIRLYRMGESGVPSLEEFLQQQLRGGKRLGCDPRLLSLERAAKLESVLSEVGARIEYVDANLVDRVWKDRPRMPADPVELHPVALAGVSVSAKLRMVRAAMRRRGADLLVVSTLDSLAWLFNIRGKDVPYNPVVIGYALIGPKRAELFLNKAKLTRELRGKLDRSIRLRPYEEFGAALRARRSAKSSVWLDPATATPWIRQQLRSCKLIREETPIAQLKARKNAAEIRGMQRCHERDGLAVVRFLAWLDEAVATQRLTERSAAAKLEEFRAEAKEYRGPSFATISGYGAHGAIIHYHATTSSDARLRPRGVYLIDSGGQYVDGTTDITRTVLLGGKATPRQKEHFTRVLKGHIALARAKFPGGVKGLRLDTLARLPLWEAGLDYNHGTGHGVGSYLNVHEGPQSISPHRWHAAELEPGNVQSNEPGFYLEGRYGIRIENLVLVVKEQSLSADEPFLGFQTLTLCPIERRLVEPKLLTPPERDWLNAYHRRVLRTLGPRLSARPRGWLRRACAPL